MELKILIKKVFITATAAISSLQVLSSKTPPAITGDNYPDLGEPEKPTNNENIPEKTRLVFKEVIDSDNLVLASHRSHSSHQSHRSHYSSSSGGSSRGGSSGDFPLGYVAGGAAVLYALKKIFEKGDR